MSSANDTYLVNSRKIIRIMVALECDVCGLPIYNEYYYRCPADNMRFHESCAKQHFEMHHKRSENG